ncbi:hypothetical protein PPERSA_08724 [Pseudocohnilembus persalinus]|uniref:Uncharacterized protein n=1 Tax=Pseudocohnilembus persalinus TaxID=266149 RepID=A0A0V0QXN9_PSEPJ|nr:hypothetical protein PPERSA_08724 [Pseudocohnilembus persalinus]|eukprot:KRX07047.1 hypothetical protein PPERSA_08724 [Pseudocohnilembus persalinus]
MHMVNDVMEVDQANHNYDFDIICYLFKKHKNQNNKLTQQGMSLIVNAQVGKNNMVKNSIERYRNKANDYQSKYENLEGNEIDPSEFSDQQFINQNETRKNINNKLLNDQMINNINKNKIAGISSSNREIQSQNNNQENEKKIGFQNQNFQKKLIKKESSCNNLIQSGKQVQNEAQQNKQRLKKFGGRPASCQKVEYKQDFIRSSQSNQNYNPQNNENMNENNQSNLLNSSFEAFSQNQQEIYLKRLQSDEQNLYQQNQENQLKQQFGSQDQQNGYYINQDIQQQNQKNSQNKQVQLVGKQNEGCELQEKTNIQQLFSNALINNNIEIVENGDKQRLNTYQ